MRRQRLVARFASSGQRSTLFDDGYPREEGGEARPPPQLKALLAGITLALASTAPLEAAEVEFDQLRTLMSCLDDPAPTTALLALTSAGVLIDRSGPGDDDDYCWSFAQTFRWQGVSFAALCVVTDDADARAAYPQLYWSAALAPWTEVWLLTATPPEALRLWADDNLPPGSQYEVDRLGDGPQESALSCSEWHFPLPG